MLAFVGIGAAAPGLGLTCRCQLDPSAPTVYFGRGDRSKRAHATLVHYEKPMAVCYFRNDGLGGRLVGLVGAIRIAQKLNTTFLFRWPLLPVQHASAPVTVNDIFAPDFVAEHYREAFAGKRVVKLPSAWLKGRPLDDLEAGSGDGDLHYRRNEIARFASETAEDVAPQAREIYRTLPFHADIRATMTAAEQAFRVPGGGKTLGMHVRLGDVAGPLAQVRWFGSKYLPLDYYRRAIDKLGDHADRIVLFSNDRKVRELIGVDSPKIHVSSEIFNDTDLNDVHRAMADMVMLGHCDEVFAPPESMFSSAASIFYGTPIRSFESIFSREELFDEWMAWQPEYRLLLRDHASVVAAEELLAVGRPKRALRKLRLVLMRIGDAWTEEPSLRALYPRCLWAAERKDEAIAAAERLLPVDVEDIGLFRDYATWIKERDPERSRQIAEAVAKLG